MQKFILIALIALSTASCKSKEEIKFQTWASEEIHEWIIKQDCKLLDHPLVTSKFKNTNNFPVFAKSGDLSAYTIPTEKTLEKCREKSSFPCFNEHIDHPVEVYASELLLLNGEYDNNFVIALSVHHKCSLCGPCYAMTTNFIFFGKKENNQYVMTEFDVNDLASRL